MASWVHNKECSFKPKGKSRLEPEVKCTLEPEGESSLELEGESSLEPEVKSRLKPEVKSRLEPEGESSLELEGESSLEPEVKSRLKPEVKSRLEPEGESSLELEGESSLELKGKSRLEPEGVSSLELEGESSLELKGKSRLEPEGVSSLELEGESSLEPEVKSRLKPEVKSRLEPEGESSLELEGESSLEPEVKSRLKPEVKSRLEPEGESSLELEGESSLELKGKSRLEPEGVSSLELEGESSLELKGKSRLEPEGVSSLELEGESSLEPEVKSRLKPEVKSRLEPEGESSLKPKAKSSTAPKVNSSLKQQNAYHIYESGMTIEQSIELAKERLVPGRFYSTNASHHKEINLKKPSISPLPSFSCLPLAEMKRDLIKGAKWDPLRVTLDTEVNYDKPKKECHSRWHPFLLANYYPDKNEAIIFMGSSKEARNQTNHRFAIVHTANPGAGGTETSTSNGDGNLGVIGDVKALTTIPANAFKVTTYLNLSHPMKVRPLFMEPPSVDSEDFSAEKPRDTSAKKSDDSAKISDDVSSVKRFVNPFSDEFKRMLPKLKMHSKKPIVVGTAEFGMQGSQSVSLEKPSDTKFRKMHMSYHHPRPFPLNPSDRNNGGGDCPSGGHRRSRGRHRSGGGGGSAGGGAGPSGGGGTSGRGTTAGGGTTSGGGSTSGGGTTSGGGGTGGKRSSCEGDGNRGGDRPPRNEGEGAGDGNRRGDGCRGGEEIDEAHETGRDEAFTKRGVLVLYDRQETGAPWGRTDDEKRIGIDVPLVNDDFSFDDPTSDDSDQDHPSSEFSDHEHSSPNEEHSSSEFSDHEHSSTHEEHPSSSNEEHFSLDDSDPEESSRPDDASDQLDFDEEKDSDVSDQQPSISQLSQVQDSAQPQVVEKFSQDLNPDIMGSFALNLMGFPTRMCGFLKRDAEHDLWNWKRVCINDKFTSHTFLTKEGLYFERCNGIQRVVNLHKNEAIVLPCTLEEDDEPDTIRCMAPLENFPEFKVIIGGYARDTMIYDHSNNKFDKKVSKYPLRDMQEWMTRGGTVVHNQGIVFILYHWRADIVAYFIDDDKWGFVSPPEHNYEPGFEPLLCGIGCWNDQIYCSTVDYDTLRIWRLENLEEDWKWERIRSMPRSDYHWLLHDNTDMNSYIRVRIFASFREEEVMFYSYSSSFAQRHLLFDLKKNGPWKRVLLPFKFEALQVESIKPASVETIKPPDQPQVEQVEESGKVEDSDQPQVQVEESAKYKEVVTYNQVTKTMESQIDEALKIIRNVSDKADHVLVNKNQCKWLARRFEKIGEALEAVKNTSSLDESAMEEILLVLKEGERLAVKSYKDKEIAGLVVRTENRETFDEVHEQIDKLKEYLFWSDPEEATEDDAADHDQNSMIQDLGNLNLDEKLRINHKVSDETDHVFVKQCEWLASRFKRIREALRSSDTSLIDDFAKEQIHLVVIKGQLRMDYVTRKKALANAASRAVIQESFKEIHEDIDRLKTILYWSDDENVRDAVPDDDLRYLFDLSYLHDLSYPYINFDAIKLAPPIMSYLYIDFDAIKLGPPIKLEGQALVHMGSWNGCEYAIKVFNNLQWNMGEVQKEVASLLKLRHPHITQLIGCAQGKGKTYVLYEKMDGDLRGLMEARIKKVGRSAIKPQPFSPTEELSIIRQIAQGMFYVHQQGIVHGELKCTNLLVKQVGNDIDVRVSDFHCSRELGSNEKYKPTHRARWLPPEAFGHFDLEHPPPDDVLKQGDVYSFAMTCCEILTGGYPFHGIARRENVEGMIQRGERPKLPDHLNGCMLKGLIEKCWSANPRERPTFEEVRYILLNFADLRMPLRPSWGGSSAAEVKPIYDQEDERVSQVSKKRGKEDIVNEWLRIFGESTSNVVQESVSEGLPHYLKIDPSNLEPISELGQGTSAQVWAATWIGCKVAVKWLNSDHVSKLRDEVDVMMKLLHPHVVRLVGFAVLAEANRCAILMELMDTSLEGFIKEKMKNSAKPPFSEAEAIVIITQLAGGMSFMHSRGRAHGDLKCANVLLRHVQTKKGKNMNVHVKLADFGSAHLKSLVKDKSPRVGAPEVILSDQNYDPMPADVYSFGIMCCEIITGKLHRPKVKPSNMREELWRLLNNCWKGPLQRPTFAQICDELAAMSPKARGEIALAWREIALSWLKNLGT